MAKFFFVLRIPTLKICVLISGGGTTLKNLLDRQAAGTLNAAITHVISNRADAGGLSFADEANIPTTVIDHREFDSLEQFSDAVFNAVRRSGADLVVMGGFLRRVLIPTDFENRVINIHPSLIPAFCGKGQYGRRVHQAVIDHGCKISGCTVHYVDDEYDHGPIIAQASVPVLPDDDAAALAARVFATECELLPSVINDIAATS